MQEEFNNSRKREEIMKRLRYTTLSAFFSNFYWFDMLMWAPCPQMHQSDVWAKILLYRFVFVVVVKVKSSTQSVDGVLRHIRSNEYSDLLVFIFSDHRIPCFSCLADFSLRTQIKRLSVCVRFRALSMGQSQR